MIGTVISLKVFGKKSWIHSILFWIVYFFIVAIAAYALSVVSVAGGIIGLVIAIVVWFGLAHYWKMFAFPWPQVIKLFIIAFIIDLVIIAILIWIWSLAGGVFPEWFPSLSQVVIGAF